MSDTEKTDVDRKRILTVTLDFITTTEWNDKMAFSSSTEYTALQKLVKEDLYDEVLAMAKLNVNGGQGYITAENGYTITFTKSAAVSSKYYATAKVEIQYKVEIKKGDSVTTKLFSQVLDPKLTDAIKTRVTADAKTVSSHSKDNQKC